MANVMDFLIRISGNGASFRRDMTEDQKAVNDFVRQLDDIHGATATIRVNDAESEAKLKKFREDIARIRDEVARVDVTSPDGLAKIEELKVEMASLKNEAVKIKVDDTGAIFAINNIRAQLDALSNKTIDVKVKEKGAGGAGAAGGGVGILGQLLMAALPLASPVGAAGLGGIMGLASAFTAATAGAAGFAAVAVPGVKTVLTATKNLNAAQKQYNEAVTSKQRQAALQKEKDALYGLSAIQRESVQQLQQFESFWHGFTASFQNPVAHLFASGLKALQTVLIDMKPTITATAVAFNALMNDFNGFLSGSDAKSFFKFLADEALPDTVLLGESFGNVFGGIMNLMVSFGPLGQSMSMGLYTMTQRFQQWTASLSKTQGFKNFINYVKTEGPQVLKLIGNLGKLAVQLLTDMAPVGAVMLQLVNHLAQLTIELTKNHPHLVAAAAAMMSVYGAYNLTLGRIPLVSNLMGMLGGKIKSVTLNLLKQGAMWALLRLRTLAMAVAQGIATAAQWAFNLAMDANPIGLIILAIAGLIAGIVLLVTHWKTVIHWLQEAWTWFNHLGAGAQIALAALFPLIAIPALIVAHWSQIKTFFERLWGDIVGYFRSHIHDFTRTADAIPKFFENLPHEAVKWGENMLSGFIQGMKNKVADVGSAAHSVMNHVANFLRFNSPAKMGPGKDILKWGRNMIGGFMDGVDAAVPALQAQMNRVLSAPAFAVSSNVASMVAGGVAAAAATAGQVVHNHYNAGDVHVHNPTVMSQRDITSLTQQIQRANDNQLRSIGVQTP